MLLLNQQTLANNWVATFPALAHDLYLNTNGARINGSSAGTYFQTTADADVITFGLQVQHTVISQVLSMLFTHLPVLKATAHLVRILQSELRVILILFI